MSLSPPPPEPVDLVLRARSGDETAREKLVAHHRHDAYLFALHLVGDPDDAMDIAQDAMVRFLTSLDRFQPGRAVKPWLFAIVRNRARDLWRRRSRRAETPLDESVPDLARALADPEPRPDERLARQEDRRRLWSALSRLTTRQREILVLRDYHDLSYADLAATLGIPLGTVMSRLHAARRALSRTYRALHGGPSQGSSQ